jgi:hypothetical protein
VRGGDEGGLELGGWKPDAGIEHGAVEAGEGGGVGGGGFGEVGDGVAGEEPGEHGADAICGEGDSGGVSQGGYAFGQGLCGGLQMGVDDVLVGQEMGEHGGAGCHRQGVPGEGSGLVDGSERGEVLHDVGAASEGSDGEAPAYDLAQGGEVGTDAVELLGSAEREAEAGHDLVQDE